MPRRRARLALVTALAAGTVLALARPAAAATTLTVDAGYGQLHAPGRSFPVRVEVRVDRLVAGSVEVVSTLGDGRRTAVSLPVEVPGGSAKSFLLVVPPQVSFDGSAPQVRARLLDRRAREVARSAEVGLRVAGDQELVGLLPGALAGRPVPAPAPLAVDAGVARFAAVGPAELAQAPFALEPLGTLAAADDELARLGPAAREGVLRWVAGGGRLIVDVAPGTPVEGLPDAWQPPAEGRVAAGRGEVAAVDGAIAAGRWAGLVEPTWPPSENAGFDGDPVGSGLADEAGLRVPDLGWLLGFALADSDLPLQVAFPMLGDRLLTDLAGATVPSGDLRVGDPLPVGGDVRLRRPGGAVDEVPAGAPAPAAERPGFHVVLQEGRPDRVLAVNAAAEESALAPADSLPVPERPPAAGERAPSGELPLLAWAVAGVLAVLAAELAVSRRAVGVPRRQWRAGLAVRAALAVLLVAAAAGIALPRRGTGVATLFLVDASDTLGAAGREAAVEWVRRSASVRRPS